MQRSRRTGIYVKPRRPATRKKIYGDDYPVDEDFLKALEFGLPASSGNALGLDRLVMLATGAEDIDLVQAAPVIY